jgi:sodium/bile acid cotransporter 7
MAACAAPTGADCRRGAAALWRFVKRQWLPLCFLVAVLFAMLLPAPGQAVLSVQSGGFRIFEALAIVLVFFISGLVLNTKDVAKARRHWVGTLYGVVSILLITPLLGFALRAIPLQPADFRAGLCVFAAAPTTLGVGAALVRSCRGNDGLATLLMTVTSVLSVFTIPIWLKALLGGQPDFNVAINIGKMLWQLLVTLLLPFLAGKALRELWAPAQRFAMKYKEYLGMLSVASLAFIVWQTLSGAQPVLIEQDGLDILYLLLTVLMQHVVYLIFNGLVVGLVLRLPIEEAVAVWVMTSQKSAPVAVTAITYVTLVESRQGLMSVPCVLGQLLQIFMGSAFAPFVARRVGRVQAARPEGSARGGAGAAKAAEAALAGAPADAAADAPLDAANSGDKAATETNGKAAA